MAATSAFKQVDLILLFSGSQLYRKSRVARVVNIFRIVFVIYTYLIVIKNAIMLRHRVNLYYFSYDLVPVVVVGLHHLMLFRRHKYKEMIDDTISLVAPEKRMQLDNTIKRYVLLLIMPITTYCLALTMFAVKYPQEVIAKYLAFAFNIDEINVIAATMGVLLLVFVTLLFLFATGILYISVIRSLKSAHDNHILKCLNCGTNKDVDRVIAFRDKLRLLYRKFDQLFNLFPVVWVAIMYFTLPGFLVFMSNRKSRDQVIETLIIKTLSLMSFIGYFTVIIYIASSIADTIKLNKLNAITQLTSKLHNNRNQVNYSLIIDCIQQCELRLTGFGLFKVNKRLILNMLGSLLTFSGESRLRHLLSGAHIT